METLFRKVLVSERVPSTEGYYFTNAGCNYYHLDKMEFSTKESIFSMDVKYWLEPIQLPSEEEIATEVLLFNNTMYHDIGLQVACNNGIKMCRNYILGFINNKK